jgi:hypothetical protein
MTESKEDQAQDTDVEESIEDVEEKEATAPYRFTVTSYGADYPVDGLIKRLKAGDIAIPTFDPEVDPVIDVEGFQRQFVWTKPQCDRFIESLLLGLPVPGIFLVKQSDGRLLVLDGQQRLRTLEAFYSGVLKTFRTDIKNSSIQSWRLKIDADLTTASSTLRSCGKRSLPTTRVVYIWCSSALTQGAPHFIPKRLGLPCTADLSSGFSGP